MLRYILYSASRTKVITAESAGQAQSQSERGMFHDTYGPFPPPACETGSIPNVIWSAARSNLVNSGLEVQLLSHVKVSLPGMLLDRSNLAHPLACVPEPQPILTIRHPRHARH